MNITSDTLIEITIEGQNVVPGKVSNHELAEILKTTEDMFTSLIEQDNPQLSKEKVFLGLVNIREGSVGLQFAPSLPDITFPAFRKITQSVQQQEYSALPSRTVKSLESIRDLAKKRDWDFALGTMNGRRVIEATINRDTVIEPVPLVSGPSTVYGYLIRVGGKTPKALLQLPNRRGLSCEFQGKHPVKQQVARELAPRIYTWIGLEGIAKWSSKDYSLREFEIQRITDYQDTPIASAVAELSQLVGKYFEGIGDPDEYVARLRGEFNGD
jgi:hypothetical protein